MTQDEIIEMATKAGLCYELNGFIDWIDAGPSLHEMTLFAKLVAAKEREACAEICDRFQARNVGMQPAECAEAIRARGEA